MNDRYESPLASRYASAFMLELFSPQKRIETWRRLWVALARAEHELGLPITAEQVKELEEHITDIDFACAAAREKEVRHDVMAHVYAYGKAAPSAAGILHLGATSCYVTDNGDLILYREALRYLRGELLKVLKNLAVFAERYKATPTLGYTHYQPGCRISSPISRSWTSCSGRCAFSAAAARPARRRAFWSSLRATKPRSTSSTAASPQSLISRSAFPSAGRPIPAKQTAASSTV